MAFIPTAFQWISRKRLNEIDLFRKHPFLVQEDGLMQLISKASATEWGKKFDYKHLRTVEMFQERLPLQKYEDIKPWVERMRQGESSVLWPGVIRWFAKSSGTTDDKSKFIPVSLTTLGKSQYQGGKDVLAFYVLRNPTTKLFSGKGLTLGGSHQIDTYGENARTGDLSAILIQNLPFWVNLIRTPNVKAALLSEWHEKLDQITRATLSQNITSISGVPSWNLVFLKHVLSVTGKKSILDVWPQLELFIHGGISFIPYRDQYRELIPSGQMHYVETYNASEGFFAIQDDPSTDDMLLMLDYQTFYEFIPLEELDHQTVRPLTIEEVVTGKNYAMVISTASGLWRYIIGDTVMFTSLYPHKVKITGRTKQFINAFGEELIVDNAEKALAEACKLTGARVRDYTAGPVYMNKHRNGSHEWLIEFDVEPDSLREFTLVLDRTLCSLNSDYEAKRSHNITLELPIVKVLSHGTFFEWMKQKGKLGGQNKVPRLSNNREYIEAVMNTSTTLTP